MKGITCALVIVLTVIISTVPAFSQSTETVTEESSKDESAGKKSFGLKIFNGRVNLAAVPIPAYNESVGWSMGLAVTGFYKVNSADTISPESVTALLGFYAENKTWAAGAFQKFHLDEDRWRMTFGGAVGEINFQTYFGFPEWIGGGTFIDYTTDLSFAVAHASRLAWKRLYLGAKYRYMRSRTVFHFRLPVGRDIKAKTFSGLGLDATWDSRDNIFYPLRGYYIDLWTLWNRAWIGSDRDYDIYYFEASGYRECRDGHVIAARIHSRLASGDVPFEDESVFFHIDLRGYADGRYRADQRHTFQAEYRWNFFRRFFAVGFGGFGWSVDKASEIAWDGILPSVGLGARWRMIVDPPVSIGIDYAWGKEEHAFYFKIGESF